MKPLINSLYRNVDTNLFYRVIAHSTNSDQIYLVSMKKDGSLFTWPFLVDPEFITQDNKIRKCEFDPFLISSTKASQQQKRVRDKRFETISKLSEVEGIYDPVIRNKIIRANCKGKRESDNMQLENLIVVNESERCNKGTFYTSLKKFFIGGTTKNSLLSKHEKCGGKDKEKNPSSKIGRPSKVSCEKFEITKEDHVKMDRAIKKYYVKNPKNSKHAAYENYLGEFFPNAGIFPTERQFQYRLNKVAKNEKVIRSRMGPKKFDKDERQIFGNSRTHAFGPGTEAQIDSTIDNIRIVSSYNPAFYIGRSTLYFVVDIATGMVVGIYLTPEPAKCDAAFMALLNTAKDKVTLAKEFGMDISPQDWDWDYLPGKILADRGELISNRADVVSEDLNIDLSNTQSYRPELKACVERIIRTFQGRIVGLLTDAGAIGPDDGERGVPDSRKKATLTHKDVMALLIKEAIWHNHNTWIKSYPLTEEMLREGVEPVPVKLFEWFLSKGYGNLQKFELKRLWQNLLPRVKATLNDNDIRWGVKDGFIVEKENLHIIKEIREFNSNIEVAYNPSCFSQTYLYYKDQFYRIFPRNGMTNTDHFEYKASGDYYAEKRILHNKSAVRAAAAKRVLQKKMIEAAKKRSRKPVVINNARSAKVKETKIHTLNEAKKIDPEINIIQETGAKPQTNKYSNDGYPE